jgi:predicted aldo/keto reductase-like oxidoreductase
MLQRQWITKKLSVHDIDYLKQYARETASNYCTGCAYVCEPIMNNQVLISDVMRYLMYSRCYGDQEKAKMAFIELPSEVRRRMGDINYDDAERKCPNKLPIGQLMREAVIELA